MDFAKALKTTANDVPKKSGKKEMARLFAPEDVKEQIDIFQKAKKDKKIAEAEMSASSEVILDFGRKHQDDDGFNGDFKNAYEIDGNEESVKYVSSNRFTVNASDEAQLREIFGDNFEDLINIIPDVRLKPEVFKDPDLQKRLMAAVGESFGEFFETTTDIKVKTDFDKNVYRAVKPEELPIVRTFCKPYKPSLR